MTMLYAAKAPATGELFSYGGRTIVDITSNHLAFVFQYCKVVPYHSYGEQTILLKDYVESQGQTWPLQRKEWS